MPDQNLSTFIWSVADLLRGDYKPLQHLPQFIEEQYNRQRLHRFGLPRTGRVRDASHFTCSLKDKPRLATRPPCGGHSTPWSVQFSTGANSYQPMRGVLVSLAGASE